MPSFLESDESPKAEPAPSAAGSPGVDSTLVGAGVAGAAVGGVLTDVVLGAAGVSLTGELLTDAAAVGAVGLGGAAVYAATRPDEAGEAARFVGGAVANTTSAYAELASVSAELAVLEQQQKAQAIIDQKVAQAKALPGDVQATVEKTVTETMAAAKAAPQNAVDTLTAKVEGRSHQSRLPPSRSWTPRAKRSTRESVKAVFVVAGELPPGRRSKAATLLVTDATWNELDWGVWHV